MGLPKISRLCCNRITRALCVSSFAMATLFAQEAAPQKKIVLRAGKMFDSVAGQMLDHPVIVISGNKIESVSNGSSGSVAGATVIDLGDATILPGFIDVHTH